MKEDIDLAKTRPGQKDAGTGPSRVSILDDGGVTRSDSERLEADKSQRLRPNVGRKSQRRWRCRDTGEICAVDRRLA